jgi:hypothetical protein
MHRKFQMTVNTLFTVALAALLLVVHTTANASTDYGTQSANEQTAVNLIKNSGFESGTTDWSPMSGSKGTISTIARTGTKALNISTGYGFWGQSPAGWSVGRSYKLGVWAKTPNNTCEIGIKGNAFNTRLTGFSTNYAYKEATVTIPSGTTWVQIYISNIGSSGDCYADDLTLTLAGTTATNTPTRAVTNTAVATTPNPTFVPPNATIPPATATRIPSTNTPAPAATAAPITAPSTNLIKNSGFESGTTDWSLVYGGLGSIVTTSRTGTKALNITGGYAIWGQSLAPFQIGMNYKLGAWARNGCEVGIKGDAFDFKVSGFGASYTYKETIATIPSGTTWVQVYVQNMGAECTADDLSLTSGATPYTPTPAPTMVPTIAPNAGRFTVVGTKIYDPQGREFIVHGVNINGPNWVSGREMTQDADLIAGCWEFNTVRVNSALYVGESQWQNYTTNNDTDRLVNAFTSRGVVVMFEAHDRTGRFYEGQELTDLVNWYRNLATRYKNNPYVWFNVMNEPGSGLPATQKDKWFTVHRAVITAIRDEVGADNIIVVDGMNWGQDAGSYVGDYVPREQSALIQWSRELITYNNKVYPNVVFSFHVYDVWNAGGAARMGSYIDQVLANNVPLIAGEYGVKNEPHVTTAAVQALFDAAGPRRIGKIAWAWEGYDENDLSTGQWLGGGYQIDNCANPTNLTWFGQMVWNNRN